MRDSDIHGSDNKIKIANLFHVSYTINNHQPVRCSHIGEDPLFFLDIDHFETEDEDMSFLSEIEELEQHIHALKDKIEGNNHDVIGAGASELRMRQFSENISSVLSSKDSNVDLNSLIKRISESRYAKEILSQFENNGGKVAFSKTESSASYDSRTNTILIHPDRSEEDKVLLLARELRRVWQLSNDGLVDPLTFAPEDAIFVNRVQTADLSISMVRVAWELYLNKDEQVWERLEDSSLAEVAHAFSREAYIDFRTLNNGRANSVTFETWFLSERCHYHDRKIIQQMLSGSYECVGTQKVKYSKTSLSQFVCSIGEMPYGKNYLAEYAHLILSDPVFTEVRNRSNANFLWFIKFENSFRIKEQELQTHSHYSTRNNSHHKNNHNSLEYNNGTEEKSVTFLQFDKNETQSGIFETQTTQESTQGPLQNSAAILHFPVRTTGSSATT